MSTSTVEIEVPTALAASLTDDTLTVDLADGRTIAVPLAWFPRLVHGTSNERNNWRIIGRGSCIHWDDLDEDISVEGLIAGHPSDESQKSFERWLAMKGKRQDPVILTP